MTTLSKQTRFQRKRRRKIAKVKLPVKGQSWEIALVAIWFALTATVLPGLELFRYACLLAFLGSSAYHWKFMLKFTLPLWFMFLFPAWVTLSAIWSPSDQALRFGIMHFVDVIAILYIALRLNPRQIIKALFYGYIFVGMLVFGDLPELSREYVSEAFTQKNLLGSRMFYLYVASLFVALDNKSHITERIIAALIAIPSFYAIFAVEATTSFVLAILSTIILISIATLWKTLQKIQSGRPLLIITGTVTALTIILGLSALTQSPVEMVLEALDKDTTLTGRTQLWADARKLIAEKPVLGLGAEGFWQLGRGDAETILIDQGKQEAERFSFHNSYLEIMVHVGIIGLICISLSLIYSVYRTAKIWILEQDLTSSFFVVMCVVSLLASVTESGLNEVFEIGKVMLFLAGLNSLSYRTARIGRKVTS